MNYDAYRKAYFTHPLLPGPRSPGDGASHHQPAPR
jgi:hypothetical protein